MSATWEPHRARPVMIPIPAPAFALLLLITVNVVIEGAWLPHGLRGDLPPWGPPVPPPWAAPPPSAVFRRPMDAMVDLTNDLGVAILQDNSHSRSNFAFSPYGLASVLVVLYEGAMGESSRQIHMAGKFPWDRDITRIGFRDIHRHLRSYFSHEGYLSGITLNKDRSSLKGDYKRVLRFYGYDVDVEPPKIPTTATEKPMNEVPLITMPTKPTNTKVTVITSIPTTVGSQVTLNASSFPGKESVDDINITEQTLVFPTTETPATTTPVKTTVLTEDDKQEQSTPGGGRPDAATTAGTADQTTEDAKPLIDASSNEVSSVSTQKTDVVEPTIVEVTTRNILDNGMLVPQSSSPGPLAETKTTTNQMQGTESTSLSDNPDKTTMINHETSSSSEKVEEQSTTAEAVITERVLKTNSQNTEKMESRTDEPNTTAAQTLEPSMITTTEQKQSSSEDMGAIESRTAEGGEPSATLYTEPVTETVTIISSDTVQTVASSDGIQSRNGMTASVLLETSTLSATEEILTKLDEEALVTSESKFTVDVTEKMESRLGGEELLSDSPSTNPIPTNQIIGVTSISTLYNSEEINTTGNADTNNGVTEISKITGEGSGATTRQTDFPEAINSDILGMSKIQSTESNQRVTSNAQEETTLLTTRRIPVTLSFKPRTKTTVSQREPTEKIKDATLDEKEIFKRSPELFQIRTLDEYLLSSDFANKAMQPPSEARVQLEKYKFIPKTLDEYLLSSDITNNKAMMPPLKTIVQLQQNEFHPKTLDEYLLSSDIINNKAMIPPFKTIVQLQQNEFHPKTLDEYLLSSDITNNKAMIPPLKTIVQLQQNEFHPKTLDEYLLSSDITNNKAIVPPLKTIVQLQQNEFHPKTVDEYLLSSDLISKSMQPPTKSRVQLDHNQFLPKTLDEYFLLKKDNKEKEVKEEFIPKTLEEYFLRSADPIQFKTEMDLKFSKYRRNIRTIADMLHIPAVPDLSLQLQNGMFDSHVSRKAEMYRPLPRQDFLVDAATEQPVPVMTYTNVFPFAYIPRLHSTAMEFPLDDERYKMLIILPMERRGLRQLTYDLSSVTLRGVLDALRPARVRATVPTFMVEGFVILTPALQRLGIWNVFDPRRANLSGMSEDPELYVRNVEQSVTVVIRNYVEILDIQTRTMAARGPEHEFRATHPFLYFVLDTETNVALMAGQMLDPLNSRIY